MIAGVFVIVTVNIRILTGADGAAAADSRADQGSGAAADGIAK